MIFVFNFIFSAYLFGSLLANRSAVLPWRPDEREEFKKRKQQNKNKKRNSRRYGASLGRRETDRNESNQRKMEGRICHQRLSDQACQVSKVPNCGFHLLGSPKRPSNHVGSLDLPMSAASRNTQSFGIFIFHRFQILCMYVLVS